MSERHACRLLELRRSTYRYRAKKPDRDTELRGRLKELAAKRMRFGYRRLTVLLAREGIAANHKRGYRLYREERLAMRIRQRRRLRWSGMETKPTAVRPNQKWSMDFVSDCVSGSKVIRILTLVDEYTRECPALEVDTSLGGLRVRRVLGYTHLVSEDDRLLSKKLGEILIPTDAKLPSKEALEKMEVGSIQ